MGKWKMGSSESAEGADIVSLIGEGTVFTGDVVFKGGARIDGKVVGRITAHSLLVVGTNGDVDAQELRATCVTVCGSVHGKLVVHERLEIQSGGRVSGHVVMDKQGLVVAPGGIFEGNIEYVREGETGGANASEFVIEATV